MLVKFQLRNYRSFCEEQTIQMVASSDKSHPNNCIETPQKRLVTTAALYGANASGKSNLLRAMDVMKYLVLNSATRLSSQDKLPDIIPYLFAEATEQQPSAFEITLLIDSLQYVYGFSATSEKIVEEWLYVNTPGKRAYQWFDRTQNRGAWVFSSKFKHRESELLRERTRDNALILSTAGRENIELLQPLLDWFSEKVSTRNISVSFPFDRFSNMSLMLETVEMCKKDENFRKQIAELLALADTGIVHLSIEEPNSELPASLLDTIRNYKPIIENLSGLVFPLELNTFKISTLRRQFDSEKTVVLPFEEESHGTQYYFGILGTVLKALSNGGLLVMDEFDSNLHPLLARKIVQLFQHPDWNKKGAQFLFATHNTFLFDRDLLRRDQIWLIEKERGASRCFSLDSFEKEKKPRNDASLARNYLRGRYGGVPIFSGELSDVDLLPTPPRQANAK